ncbi:hypothetical protein CEXT_271141, partial [Caerostris extrusa]
EGDACKLIVSKHCEEACRYINWVYFPLRVEFVEKRMFCELNASGVNRVTFILALILNLGTSIRLTISNPIQ